MTVELKLGPVQSKASVESVLTTLAHIMTPEAIIHVVWRWAGAHETYSGDWVVNSGVEAVNKFIDVMSLSETEVCGLKIKNRDLIAKKYSEERVFLEMDKLFFLEQVFKSGEVV